MIRINREFNPTISQALANSDPIDNTEWLDWDHWRAAEEYQDLVDGLSNIEDSSEYGAPKTFKDGEWDENVARQLHRHGFEIDG